MNLAKKMAVTSILALSVILCITATSNAAPLGTAFTYQGHLYDAKHVANGPYDFQFRVFDDSAGTAQIGPDFIADQIEVIDGYFTVELDFGTSIFTGDAKWLQIGVRAGDLEDPNEYTALTPLQNITAVPYALYAESAGDSAISVPLELSGSLTSPDAVIKGTNTSNGWGVSGANGNSRGSLGGFGCAVYGYSTTCAGQFDGTVLVNGTLYATGPYRDGLGSPGTAGQVLSSTVTGTSWIDPPTVSVPLELSGNINWPDSILKCVNQSTGYAIHGISANGDGIKGLSALHYGMLGSSIMGIGVRGEHDNGNYGTLGSNANGAYGKHESTGNYGTLGSNGSGAFGTYGSNGNYGTLGK